MNKKQAKVPGMKRPETEQPREQQMMQLPPKRTTYETGALFITKMDLPDGEERIEVNLVPPPGVEMVTFVLDKAGKEAMLKMLSGGIQIAQPGDIARIS